MKAYAQAVGLRSLYSMALRDGNIVFGPESLDEDDPWASPPGTVYEEPSELDFEIFETGIPIVQGPEKDEYGTFVTAQAPVFDPDTNKVLLVIGMDVEAGEWQALIDRARRVPILFTLALGLILLSGAIALYWRNRFPAERGHRLHYTEACLTAALGLLLTGIVAWAVHQDQVSSRREVFKQLSFSEMVSVRGAFEEIRINLIQTASFFRASEEVDRQEFHLYTRSLVQSRNLETLLWIPIVPAHYREIWETEVRNEGSPDFMIHERGEDGESQPVSGRDPYYPALYVEPMQGNEQMMGYDFGSIPRYRSALEEAAKTRLPVITESVESRQTTEGSKTLFVFYPIYFRSSETNGGAGADTTTYPLRGFVLAMINPQNILTHVLNPFDRENAPTVVDLFEVVPGNVHRFLASSSRKHAGVHENGSEMLHAEYADLSMIYPLLVVNDTYVLVVYPGPAFLQANPVRVGWTAGLVGLLLTALVAAFVGFLSNRWVDLERQVLVRTAELQEAQQRFHTILDVTGTRIDIIDSEYNLQYVDPGWQKDRGDPTDRKCYEYFMGYDQPCEDCLAARALETRQVLIAEGQLTPENEHIFEVHRIPFQDHTGRWLVAEFSVDIDRRKRAEEALRESEERMELALQGADLGTWDWNIVTGEVIFNKRWAEIVGYSLDEIEPHLSTWERLVYPDDMPGVMEVLNAHLEGKTESYEAEHRLIHKSGNLVWILDKGRVIERDRDGRPLRACGTHLDITERKRADEALQRRLAYERAAATCTGILAEPTSLDDQLPTVLRILREAAGADRAYIFQNEDDPERGLCMNQIYESVAEGVSSQIDNPVFQHHPYQEGASFVLSALAERRALARVTSESEEPLRTVLEAEGVLSFLLLPIYCGTEFWGFIGFDDCTTVRVWQEEDTNLLQVVADSVGATILRKKAEEQLRLQGLVLDQIQDRVTITDLSGVITYVNESETQAFRCTREDLVSHSTGIYGEDPERGATQKEILETTLRDGHWRGEVVNYAADGREFFLDCRTQVVHDPQGNPIALCGIATDITDRKRAEEALRRRLDYEQAAADCVGILLESSGLDDRLQPILDILLKAVNCSRVYVFQNEHDLQAGICMTQTHEAASEGIAPQIDNPVLQHLPYRDSAPSLLSVLQDRQSYARIVAEIDSSEREVLESQGILSILILPIHCGAEFWGFIGFDDCSSVRRWQEEDANLLQVVADGIGVAVQRTRAEEALRIAQREKNLILENIAEHVVYHDLDLGIIWANAAAAASANTTPEDLIGRKCHQVWRGSDTPCEYCPVEPAIRTGRVCRAEVISPDGHCWSIAGSPVRDDNGDIIGAVETTLDITDRKRAEEALRDSEQRLADIFDFLPDASFVIDMNGKVMAWNRAMEEMTGIKARDILGKGDHEYALPFYGIRRPILIDLVLTPDEEVEKKYHFVKREGNIVLAEADVPVRGEMRALWIIGKPLYDSGGNIVGAIESIRDITDRKRAEEALRNSEQRLSDIFDFLPDPTFVTDMNGKVVAWNRAIEQMTKIRAEDILGKGDYEYALPFYGIRRPILIDLIFTPHPEVEKQYRYLGRDGDALCSEADVLIQGAARTIWGIAKPLYDSGGSIVGAIESMRDITDRKKAEEALLNSERRLSDIFDFLPDATFVIDTNGTVVAWNRAIEEMTGVKAGDILGKGDYEYSVPFYGIRRPILIDLVFLSDNEIKDKYHFVRKEGDTVFGQADVPVRGLNRILWGVARPLYNSGGNIVGAIESIRDVTESERAEVALRESEARVRRKLDAILEPEGDIGTLELSDILDIETIQSLMDEFNRIRHFTLAVIDLQGKVLAASGWEDICTQFHRVHPETLQKCNESDMELTRGATEGAFKLYKCKNNLWSTATPIIVGGKLVGNMFLGQFFYDDEEPDVDLFRRQAQQYGFDEEEYLAALDRVPRVSREMVDALMAFFAKFSWMVSHLSYGNIKLARILAERDHLLNTLLESETMLNDAQEIAGIGSFVWDLRTDSVEYSRNIFSMAGVSPGDFPGSMDHLVRTFVHPDDRPRVEEEMWKMVESRETWPLEFRVIRPDAQERIIQSSARFIPDEEGGPNKCVGLIWDITERKEAEKEKEKLQAQLLQAQKMESVGRLAGGVAHDFNNMLQAIFGYTDMALDQVDREHPLYSSLQAIQKAAQRSANLTRQLLAFARKQTVSPRILDLNDTVTGMLKMLRRLIGEDIDLAWLPAHEPCNVKVDPSQIDQILANLTINARDAVNGVGRITIETNPFVFDEAFCAVHEGAKPGKYVLLTVSDTGCGMDKETLLHVFEPFFTTKGVGEGTGLGLATVYGTVKQNDGFIDVYSEPGHGTTFKIYLPRYEEESAVESVELTFEAPPGGTETVLIVEDDEAILNMASEILGRLGYTVLTANTPQQAIQRVEEHTETIHLLVTDVVMPEMNGRVLAERLTSLKPGFKCLFMSGYTANIIAHHGVIEEGVRFIEKPFSIYGLAKRVREVLEG
ncbi:MAG TPA: PAS domain S-box protein [bacterium]|nr:PAS domain S-box protein [bacterium]